MTPTLYSGWRAAQKEGRILKNPLAEVEYAREPVTLPKSILTPEEAAKVIEGVDITNVLGLRDRAILETFYATGIRSRELINLEVGDINFEEELLRVNNGKFAKDRVIPLGRMACKFLDLYLKGARPELLREKGTKRLFLTFRGKELDLFNLGKMVKRYAQKAGITKRMTCHVWRHSCATHLLKNRANLRHVQQILGHGSLVTTEKYLHLGIADLKEAHAKFHPREKK